MTSPKPESGWCKEHQGWPLPCDRCAHEVLDRWVAETLAREDLRA